MKNQSSSSISTDVSLITKQQLLSNDNNGAGI